MFLRNPKPRTDNPGKAMQATLRDARAVFVFGAIFLALVVMNRVSEEKSSAVLMPSTKAAFGGLTR